MIAHEQEEKFRRQPQGPVDPGSDPGGEDPVAVDHNALVDWDRAEHRQQVERRPVRGCPASLQQPGGAADQRPGAEISGESRKSRAQRRVTGRS